MAGVADETSRVRAPCGFGAYLCAAGFDLQHRLFCCGRNELLPNARTHWGSYHDVDGLRHRRGELSDAFAVGSGPTAPRLPCNRHRPGQAAASAVLVDPEPPHGCATCRMGDGRPRGWSNISSWL